LADDLARALAGTRPLLAAASTAEGEESMLLDAFRRLHARHPGLRLLLAPRRADRFDAVARLAAASGFDWVRRSTIGTAPDAAVLLLDSIGELPAVFGHATVVFMGGTLVPRGGHNVLEPARFARPIVFGPHMENFRDMARAFLAAEAAVQVEDA